MRVCVFTCFMQRNISVSYQLFFPPMFKVSNLPESLADCPRLKVVRLEENCLPITAFGPRIMKDSKISLFSVEGNVFDSKAFHNLEGYEQVSIGLCACLILCLRVLSVVLCPIVFVLVFACFWDASFFHLSPINLHLTSCMFHVRISGNEVWQEHRFLFLLIWIHQN